MVPAGEAFPPALVEPWTRYRRQIINTYGPTEASTDTSRQSLRPGEPITIGSPFANVTYVILEIDGLRPLPHGESGELCIGGVHVARAIETYPSKPPKSSSRTLNSDASIAPATDARSTPGHTVYISLAGSTRQLKVRGHRVEAQAVENILQTQFSDIEAAVLDYQNEELIAFVRAPSVHSERSLSWRPHRQSGLRRLRRR